MAWTTPGTATAGEVLTAAFWNEQVRDNALAIRNAQVNVVEVLKDDGNVTSSGGTEQTVLTLSITPSSGSSKILLIANAWMDITSGASSRFGNLLIYRGATQIKSIGAGESSTTGRNEAIALSVLDSPNTTSSITYTLRVNRGSAGTTDVTIIASDTRNGPRLVAIEVPV